MKTMHKKIYLTSLILLLAIGIQAQEKVWTLNECINYALSKNIDVQQASLSNRQNELALEQTRASRLPSVNASINQNFKLSRTQNTLGVYGPLTGSNGTSYALNSSVSVYNGGKINEQIKQSNLNLLSSQYYTETVKQSLELNVLDAFLQVLYAQESVNNAQKQIEATSNQLGLSKERLDLGDVSLSDYLQIKSELASEKLTLANAKSQLAIARLNLMQLMELPVTDDFALENPNLDQLLIQEENTTSSEVYQQALSLMPQIKQAELNTQSASLDSKIAKADLYPSVSLSAAIGSSSSFDGSYLYTEQLNNTFSPSVGLTVSIPIFQKKQVKTNISLAQISYQSAQLTEISTRNQLRKEVEQATVDVESAKQSYEASLEQYQSAQESSDVATEKFNLGLLNSVDYLFEKTNLITSESNLLQAKYNLIFSYKILDFYKGISITL